MVSGLPALALPAPREGSQGQLWQWMPVDAYAACVPVFQVSFGQVLRQKSGRKQAIVRHSQRMFSAAFYRLL